MAAIPPQHPLRETLVVTGGVYVAALVLAQLSRSVPGLAPYEQLLFALAFLIPALRLARREGPDGMRRHGIALSGLLVPPAADDERPPGPLGLYDLLRAVRAALPSGVKESGVALAIAALCFPPFVVGFQYWHQPNQAFELVWPDELLAFAATQLLIIALPEEAFFRGYVQTRLHDRFPPRHRLLGVELHLGVLLAQAALFALVHFIVIPNPARLAVFFPALLFGWLRAWRGGIGAAMLLHALSNVLAELLEKGYGLR